MEPCPKRRSRERIFCGHCSEYLPKTTFYRHRDTFFNSVSNEWNKQDDHSGGSCSAPRKSHEGGSAFNVAKGETAFESESSDEDVDHTERESGPEPQQHQRKLHCHSARW